MNNIRTTCPCCMAALENTIVQPLPESKWEQAGGSVLAMGGAAVCAPVLNALAFGECPQHGLQQVKVAR